MTRGRAVVLGVVVVVGVAVAACVGDDPDIAPTTGQDGGGTVDDGSSGSDGGGASDAGSDASDAGDPDALCTRYGVTHFCDDFEPSGSLAKWNIVDGGSGTVTTEQDDAGSGWYAKTVSSAGAPAAGGPRLAGPKPTTAFAGSIRAELHLRMRFVQGVPSDGRIIAFAPAGFGSVHVALRYNQTSSMLELLERPANVVLGAAFAWPDTTNWHDIDITTMQAGEASIHVDGVQRAAGNVATMPPPSAFDVQLGTTNTAAGATPTTLLFDDVVVSE